MTLISYVSVPLQQANGSVIIKYFDIEQKREITPPTHRTHALLTSQLNNMKLKQ